MNGGAVVREARRRAGLTQSELARRIDTTQSAVARLESGRSDPSYGRVEQIVRACGFDLRPSIVPSDESDWSLAEQNLAVGIDERVRRHQAVLRFAREGRAALERRRARA